MDDSQIRRLTGAGGIAVGVLATLVVPLYFVYSEAPPAWIVLTRALLTLLSCAGFFAFVAGLRHLIRRADASYDWLAC